MKSGRFFVTSVLILGMAGFTACSSKKDNRKAKVREGTEQIKTAAAAQNELGAKYNIILVPGTMRAANGKVANPQTIAEEFNWMRLTKEERQGAKEKLAEFVAAVTRTFEIESKKGLYITGKDILQSQVESAVAYQKSLLDFENIFGENFEPKNPKDQPLFNRTRKV